MRQVLQALVAGSAVLLLAGCAGRQSPEALAQAGSGESPVCNGEPLLEVESRLNMDLEVVERRERNGVAMVVASLAPGGRTTVRVPRATGTWYEARVVGTNQPLAVARYGRATHGPLIKMDVQCR